LLTWTVHDSAVPHDYVIDPQPWDDELMRAQYAAPPRTPIDIFHDTVSEHPGASAVDNGAEQLTYEEPAEAADQLAAELHALGVGRGDRVGVRVKSGTTTLYVAILGVLTAGAAYVPVDAEDPDDRAPLVFEEAGVAAVIGSELTIPLRRPAAAPQAASSPGPGAMRGSSSPLAPRAHRMVWQCRTDRLRPSSTPSPGCSCRTIRWARLTSTVSSRAASNEVW
jgi:non-ribosomal peptide synthetase component F